MNGCAHWSHKEIPELDYLIKADGQLYPYRCEQHFREQYPDKTPELLPYRSKDYKRELSISKLAEYLGVSYASVRKAVSKNEIPFFRWDEGERHRYIFHLDMIEDWMKGRLTGGEKNRFEYELEAMNWE